MAYVRCVGLPAEWINGWLAAVGITVLDSRIRLQWTSGPTPTAVLSVDEGDPIRLMASSWPDAEALNAMPLASTWQPDNPIGRKVNVDALAARASAARDHPQSWTISSTMTDLHVDKNGEVAHARFDVSGPGPIKWLHHRVLKLHRTVPQPSPDRLMDSLLGQAPRVKDNGLGFDLRRLGSLADDTDPFVDPIVEILAFFGLALFPVRGFGTDERLTGQSGTSSIQRGWRLIQNPQTGRGERRFLWPAWSQPLDRYGIDALLDAWLPDARYTWGRLGVHTAWKIIPYRGRAQADSTRAFGSERW